MKPRSFAGLLKFFREEAYLNQLLDGQIYGNTPEYYRLHHDEGVRDPNESVGLSVRSERNDPPANISFDGKRWSDAPDLTVRFRSLPDHWLHCWTVLRFPANDEELDQLVKDLWRIRREFGYQYAFIPKANVRTFAERLTALFGPTLRFAEIRYSDDPADQSPACKYERFRYQREGRFLLDACPPDSVEPIQRTDEATFKEIVLKSAIVELRESDDAPVFFRLKSGLDDGDRLNS